MEMICAIVHQLTGNLTAGELQAQGFAAYYADHTIGLWPQAASGEPFSSATSQSTFLRCDSGILTLCRPAALL